MSSTQPKISIITPSYNQGQFIEQTICSVLDQNYPHLEYIINDGGSSDETVSIIKKYEQGITSWTSEKDNGQSDAINKGFRAASGEIINWLNSDDYYQAGALPHVALQFEDLSISCYGGCSNIFGGEREYVSQGTDVYAGNLAKTIGWARIDQPETFFRKTCIDEIGCLNECLHMVMDKDLWIRYLCRYGLDGIKKDKQVLVNFRHHDNSKTISLKEQFDQETQNLFYTYACQLDMPEVVKKFELSGAIQQLPLKYFPEGLAATEWLKVFNYFFLYKALAAYAVNDYKQAAAAFKCVDKNLLLPEDKKEMQKVQARMNYLPLPLKKLLNRFL